MRPVEAAILSLGTGAVVALAAVPIAGRIAQRTGFLDKPVGYKKHGRPTPYLGGAAVILAFIVAAVLFGEGIGRFLPVVVIAIGFWVVGTIDDRINLSPWLRIGATVAGGAGLWATGLGWNIFDGATADLLLTVLWVLGLVNAFNLMDNMDGASSSVAAAAAVGVGAFALVNDDLALVALSFALVGACLGFLRSNLARPARIFLGDGGSMPVGFIVAAMAISAPSIGELHYSAVFVGALLVGLVILDTALVIVSRRRHGVPLMTGGRDHLTHRLLGIFGTPRRVAAALAATQLGLCAIALLSASMGPAVVAWAAAAAGVAGIAAITVLERRMDKLEAKASARRRPLASAYIE